jgi:hypothetical protein
MTELRKLAPKLIHLPFEVFITFIYHVQLGEIKELISTIIAGNPPLKTQV